MRKLFGAHKNNTLNNIQYFLYEIAFKISKNIKQSAINKRPIANRKYVKPMIA